MNSNPVYALHNVIAWRRSFWDIDLGWRTRSVRGLLSYLIEFSSESRRVNYSVALGTKVALRWQQGIVGIRTFHSVSSCGMWEIRRKIGCNWLENWCIQALNLSCCNESHINHAVNLISLWNVLLTLLLPFLFIVFIFDFCFSDTALVVV